MVEDRDYMRERGTKLRYAATVALLAANILVYLYQYYLLPRIAPAFPFEQYFALSLDGLKAGYFWQLLTYQFMHGGFWHLFFNCWMIFVFGRELESALGRGRMLAIYFLSGVMGGLVQMLFARMFPTQFGDAMVVGASAGAFGLIAAFAVLFPNENLLILLLFVIPLFMRARTLLWVSAALTVFGILIPFLGMQRLDNLAGNFAHAAHLGGILTGFLFAHLLRGVGLPSLMDDSAKSSLKITPAPE